MSKQYLTDGVYINERRVDADSEIEYLVDGVYVNEAAGEETPPATKYRNIILGGGII